VRAGEAMMDFKGYAAGPIDLDPEKIHFPESSLA
jgi:hypothetical protein